MIVSSIEAAEGERQNHKNRIIEKRRLVRLSSSVPLCLCGSLVFLVAALPRWAHPWLEKSFSLGLCHSEFIRG